MRASKSFWRRKKWPVGVNMEVIITPFWIVLSFVYFWLAAVHYKRRFVITPSTYIASAYTKVPDDTSDDIRFLRSDIQRVFKRFVLDIEQNRELMKYASVGFFVAGVVSLLQGITNLEGQFSINILFVLIAAIIVLAVLYWRWRWVFYPITEIRLWRRNRKLKKQLAEQQLAEQPDKKRLRDCIRVQGMRAL